MVWLSNSNTHCKVQYDSTPILSKDIYNKYTGLMQSLLYKKKEVLELRRSIACLGGISNKDNVFRHGPCREVLESLLIFACIDPCGVTAYRKGACS